MVAANLVVIFVCRVGRAENVVAQLRGKNSAVWRGPETKIGNHARIDGHTREGIVAHGIGKSGALRCRALSLAKAFIQTEEKCLVAEDGARETAAELIPL